MQQESLELKTKRQDAIPILDLFLKRMNLVGLIGEHIKHDRHVHAILLLLKNILIDHQATYAIREWSGQYDPSLVYGGSIGDDVIARALDRLFESDRATLQTKIILKVLDEFKVDTSQLHNDSTTVKVFGQYDLQHKKGVQLKRGHSKDHRSDLKQLLYSVTVSSDGAIPIHFKVHRGNMTDDQTHWETWSTLRSLFRNPDFLYVADSKLCTEETMRKIDHEHGKFVTVLPRTRKETQEFYAEVYSSIVRWDYLYKKRCTRKKQEYDIFELAEGFYQTQEGFRIHWYRSNKKRERDRQSREDRMDLAMEKLARLADEKRRGPKTQKSLTKSVHTILAKYKVSDWISVECEIEKVETFKKRTKGRPSKDANYQRLTKKKARLMIKKNREAIDRAKAIDGIFPLATNDQLSALETLKSYKYQPYVEKRHSLLKSSLEAAPLWLKRNDRIESLMFVFFLAQLLAAILEREVREAMKRQQVTQLPSLPENRNSKTPTIDQIFRLFEHRSYHILYNRQILVKTFADPLSSVQRQILNLLNVPENVYLK